jgi:hypothetical protein
MKNWKSKMPEVIICSLILMMILFAHGFGQGDSNARALGMGGAYTALARDLDAPNWNPANLGLSDGRNCSIGILNMGLRLRNNSFSLADYNRYDGKYLTTQDKNRILNSIPESGLNINMGAEVAALNFSVGNFALTYKALASSDVFLDRDPFKLLFLGNAVMHSVSLSRTQSEAYALADVALSYGQNISKWPGGELSIGGSLHYLRGLAYEKVMESEGGVVTTDTGFVGSGFVRLHTATGGSGYSSDLGLAGRFEENWYFSAAIQNLYSKVGWNTNTKESIYSFNMKPITLETIIDENNNNSLVSKNDTSYGIYGFSSKLSPIIKMGLARKYKKLIWSAEWDQALAQGPTQGINPRVAGGIEYKAWKFLPLRAGMALGGGQGAVFSTGFGIHYGPYEFDLGMANCGSPLPSYSSGARLAMGMALRF